MSSSPDRITGLIETGPTAIPLTLEAFSTKPFDLKLVARHTDTPPSRQDIHPPPRGSLKKKCDPPSREGGRGVQPGWLDPASSLRASAARLPPGSRHTTSNPPHCRPSPRRACPHARIRGSCTTCRASPPSSRPRVSPPTPPGPGPRHFAANI